MLPLGERLAELPVHILAVGDLEAPGKEHVRGAGECRRVGALSQVEILATIKSSSELYKY
jgi:hypothetical protein